MFSVSSFQFILKRSFNESGQKAKMQPSMFYLSNNKQIILRFVLNGKANVQYSPLTASTSRTNVRSVRGSFIRTNHQFNSELMQMISYNFPKWQNENHLTIRNGERRMLNVSKDKMKPKHFFLFRFFFDYCPQSTVH